MMDRSVDERSAAGWTIAQEKETRKMETAPLVQNHEDRFKPKEAELVGNYWVLFTGWLKFSLCPGLIFTFTSMAFMLGYHACPRILIGIAILPILLLAFNAFQSWRRSLNLSSELKRLLLEDQLRKPKGQQVKTSPEEVNIGLQVPRLRKLSVCFGFCAFAVFIGGVVGTSIHLTNLIDYWTYNGRRHYTNVAPDEPAAAHADASVLVFMEGTRPDATRTMGYRRHGHVFCVAPVDVDSSQTDQTPLTDIQYWAVGKDCCDKGFMCDHASNNAARSGLVLSDPKGMDAIGRGVLSNEDLHYYEEAVKMGLSKFDLTSPNDRMFARFVADIQQAHDAYYADAWWSWFRVQLLFMPLWMAAGLMTVLVGYSEYKDHIGDVKQYVLYNMNHVC